MTKIVRSIGIKAAPEEVFQYTRDWQNYAQFYDGLYDWRPTTSQTPGIGARFAYKAKALGRWFEVETEVTDEVENRSRTFASVRGAQTRGQWLFEPVAGGIKVTCVAEYTLPVPLVGGCSTGGLYGRSGKRSVRPCWRT
jgi:ribosome-associated toxin RatA of RatAB toxin-antitoxin module